MKYVDEYRDPAKARRLLDAIRALVTAPRTIMEICGGQTHAIVKYGIDELLPPEVTLVHGPGCPVCVTPVGMIDRAIAIAAREDVIFTSFGDMARVPGTSTNLLAARARGADLRLVYSPLEAVALARENRDREVVFFAVGFETTAPATAMAVQTAKAEGLDNFSMLVAHVLVPPAMEAILAAPERRIDAFLAAGHVCTVTGYSAYHRIAEQFGIPIVVTGFEPVDILQGVYLALLQLEDGRAEVENQYTRAVRESGNETAQAIVAQVFHVTPRHWRGIGELASSGLSLAPAYAAFDAERRFGVAAAGGDPASGCISGAVLQGAAKPADCPHFGTACTPERPMGAPMVSSEGACAAYFRHRRRDAHACPT